MEKRISKKIETYVTKFKDDIRDKLMSLNVDNKDVIIFNHYFFFVL